MNAVQHNPDMIERVMLEGDLTNMSVQERINYYAQVCESMHLNPLTKPFDYLRLNGKLVLYANKNCAEQLRRNLKMSISLVEKKIENGVYIVTARVEADGRCDEATGAVPIDGLKGDALANALMKCETKAKRRATLSFAGLGMLDETEIDSIPGAQRVSEKDITPTASEQKQEDAAPPAEKPLQGRPETLRAQAAWEARRRALQTLPQDVKDGLNWYCQQKRLTDKARSEKINAVFDENHGDADAIRSWLRDNGWQGSAGLSDVAAHDMLPDVLFSSAS